MITREDLVVQSVTDYAKAQVRAWGYDEDVWTWEERFDAAKMATFDKTRDAVEQDAVIPLLDYQDPAKPQIDALELLAVSSNRATPPDPEPWEEFLWLVAAQVQDVYHARLS
jgi:hypothetical protein